jgi:hypothetical protein
MQKGQFQKGFPQPVRPVAESGDKFSEGIQSDLREKLNFSRNLTS